MMKRSLLAVAVTALTAQAAYAAPFMPMDARGLAMGNTGVASAKRAHAPAYNPSLLSQGSDKDDFAIIFPQFGVSVADERELVDEAEKISDTIFPAFEDAIQGVSGGSIGLDANIQILSTRIDDLMAALNAPTPDLTDIQNANIALGNSFAAVDNDLVTTQSAVGELTNSLRSISGDPLAARLGVGGALAIPSKKFAAAVSVQGSANISARVNFSDRDLALLNAYIPATQEFLSEAQNVNSAISAATDGGLPTQPVLEDLIASVDSLRTFESITPDGTVIFQNGELSGDASNPDLDSNAQFVAVSVIDIGLSFSREFEIKGEKIAIGITPKLQKISTYHYADEVDGFEDVKSDDFEDSRKDYSKFNLDVGASYRFGESGKWMVGVVAKNLLGGSFKYEPVLVTPKDSDGNPTGMPYTIDGGSVKLNPQLRAGVAYNGSWTSVAFDLDLIENDPVAFENPTQYAALGVELDVFSFMQLRAGYRTNLSASDASVASVGLGLSPFGVHLDIAAMANPSKPEKEAGVALEMGFYF